MKESSSQDVTEALEYMIPFFKDSIKSINLNDRIQGLWSLESIQHQLGDEDLYYDPESRKEIIESVAALSPVEAAKLSPDFKYQEIKRYFAKLIEEANEKWAEIYGKMLLETPIKIHKDS